MTKIGLLRIPTDWTKTAPETYKERLVHRVSKRVPKYQDLDLIEIFRSCIENELNNFSREPEIIIYKVETKGGDKIIVEFCMTGKAEQLQVKFSPPTTIEEAIALAIAIADRIITEGIAAARGVTPSWDTSEIYEFDDSFRVVTVKPFHGLRYLAREKFYEFRKEKWNSSCSVGIHVKNSALSQADRDRAIYNNIPVDCGIFFRGHIIAIANKVSCKKIVKTVKNPDLEIALSKFSDRERTLSSPYVKIGNYAWELEELYVLPDNYRPRFIGGQSLKIPTSEELEKIERLYQKSLQRPKVITFGNGDRTSYEDLDKAIAEHNITHLINVKLRPKKAFSWLWTKAGLQKFCQERRIEYLEKTSLGNTIQYGKHETKTTHWVPPDREEADRAIEELSAIAREETILLFCAEKKYSQCHRTKVAQAIAEQIDGEVVHV